MENTGICIADYEGSKKSWTLWDRSSGELAATFPMEKLPIAPPILPITVKTKGPFFDFGRVTKKVKRSLRSRCQFTQKGWVIRRFSKNNFKEPVVITMVPWQFWRRVSCIPRGPRHFIFELHSVQVIPIGLRESVITDRYRIVNLITSHLVFIEKRSEEFAQLGFESALYKDRKDGRLFQFYQNEAKQITVLHLVNYTQWDHLFVERKFRQTGIPQIATDFSNAVIKNPPVKCSEVDCENFQIKNSPLCIHHHSELFSS